MGSLHVHDPNRELDGITATFRSRADADLAIEHMTQEYGIDPAFIYAEPVADENSAGSVPSGGDRASACPSHGDRADAPLHGAIQLTVSFAQDDEFVLKQALKEYGALSIEQF